MATSAKCKHCEEARDRIQLLEEAVEDDSTRRDELDVELEIAKIELKELRKKLEDKLINNEHSKCLERAVTKFDFSYANMTFGYPEDEEDSKMDSEERQPTYNKDGVVLDELDQALTDAALLKGQVKQLEQLNRKLQEMYRDAEVKHAMAQFRISKLEKSKRELLLAKAEVISREALEKLDNERKHRISTQKSERKLNKIDDIESISANDAEKGLLSAAQNGDLTTVNLLVERFCSKETKNGEDDGEGLVNCRNRDGWTPLMLASARGHLPVVIKLLEVGGDPAIKETDLGYTALHLAAWNNRPNVVKHLIEEAGCDVDPEGESLRTPLMLAANWGATAALRVLLDLGANPNHKDTRGKTAIDWARDKAVKATLQEAKEKFDQKEVDVFQSDV